MSCLGIVIRPVRRVGRAVHCDEDRAPVTVGEVVDDREQRWKAAGGRADSDEPVWILTAHGCERQSLGLSGTEIPRKRFHRNGQTALTELRSPQELVQLLGTSGRANIAARELQTLR
jgi:hypothetical protein